MTRYQLYYDSFIRLFAISILCAVNAGCDGAVDGESADAAIPTADAGPTADAPDDCLGEPVIDWHRDSDGDGYGDPADVIPSCGPIIGYIDNNGDCDDTLPDVNPEAQEICGDSLDNDCQGGDPCDAAMIAHWRFDEGNGDTAEDATGNGHDARFVDANWNGAGNAADFDGTNGYVIVDHAPEFLVEQGTIALWFRTRTEVADQGIWSKDSSGFDTGGHVTMQIDYDEVDGTGNQLAVRMQDTAQSYYVSINSIEAMTWYHVVFTFGPNGMSLWINGVMRDSENYVGGMDASSGDVGNYEPLAMGMSTHVSDNMSVEPTSQHLDGLIRDVRVFDRSLIASEILDIYNQSSL